MSTSRLQTYGDWSDFLAGGARVVDSQVADAVKNGAFEPDAQRHMLLLIKKTLENSINARTEELQRWLNECGSDPDDFVVAFGRYERHCRYALVLCDVRGLPAAEASCLRKESMDYIANVASVLRSGLHREDGDDDLQYWLARFENRWICV